MSDESSTYKLTHKTRKHRNVRYFVNVSLKLSTIDSFETSPTDSLAYTRAENAICAKFRQEAGRKYFADPPHNGTWPEEYKVTMDDLEYEEIVSKLPRTSTTYRRS